MGEYIEVSKKAFGRIKEGMKTTVGLSVLSAITLLAVFVGNFSLIKGQWGYGIVLVIMGLITELFIGGYMVENYHNLQKNKKLPKLVDKIGERLAWGILAAIITLIYMIPAIITQAILYTFVGRTIITIGIVSAVTIIFAFPALAGVIEFSKKNKFKDAFTKEVCKNAYKPRFVGYTIAAYIIGYAIIIGLLLTVAGWILFGAIGILYIQHMVVEGYTKKAARKTTNRKTTKKATIKKKTTRKKTTKSRRRKK